METTTTDGMGQTYNVEIEPRKSIRLHGVHTNHVKPYPYDKTFRIGDQAEYDSYNLSYVGTIVAIGEKTVTIEHGAGQKQRSRLSLRECARRNYDFDLDRIRAENQAEM